MRPPLVELPEALAVAASRQHREQHRPSGGPARHFGNIIVAFVEAAERLLKIRVNSGLGTKAAGLALSSEKRYEEPDAGAD